MILPASDYEARALRHPDAIKRRYRLLADADHMTKLREFCMRLRRLCSPQNSKEWLVPDFDPASGGERARALFLFEKPGPKTSPARKGSGFISVHNNDGTAANTHKFIHQNGLRIEDCLFWNVVPFWDGTRKISSDQLRLAQELLPELLNILPEVVITTLVGLKAQSVWDRCGLERSPRVFFSFHPSPINHRHLNSIPGAWPTAIDLQTMSTKQY